MKQKNCLSKLAVELQCYVLGGVVAAEDDVVVVKFVKHFPLHICCLLVVSALLLALLVKMPPTKFMQLYLFISVPY